jgi:hypothetical protein
LRITLSWKDFAILSNILPFAFDDNLILESSAGNFYYGNGNDFQGYFNQKTSRMKKEKVELYEFHVICQS